MWALSDESLLAGLGSGDPEAVAAFVRRFQARVFGLSNTILRDRDAAADAAQETFLRAWRNAGIYDPRRGAVQTWLLTIARNVSVDMLRLRRPDPLDPAVVAGLLEARHDDPGDPYVLADRKERLRRALGELPKEQRRALVFAAFYGRTSNEISQIEDIPQGTVKTRIRTAMLKLEAALKVNDD